MSNTLNKKWAYAMIYRNDLFVKACQVDLDGSGMTSDDLILDFCQPNQAYRIVYYNADWEIIKVDLVETPDELGVSYVGKNTVVVTYPYNAGEQIEIIPSTPSTLHHTSSKGQTEFNGLIPNQNYSVILRDSNDNQVDIVKVKTNDLEIPTAVTLRKTDKRIKWQVTGAKYLTAKVYKLDDLYGTIYGEAYIGSNTQEVEAVGLEKETSYAIVIENNPIWKFVETSNPKFILPIDPIQYNVTLTSPIGYRERPSGTQLHKGWDFCGKSSYVEIRAISDGVVEYTGEDEEYFGNRVAIKHVHNNVTFFSIYQHLRSVSVAEGQDITQGDIIGIQGGTGGTKSYPDHLHFQASLEADPKAKIQSTVFDIFTGVMINGGSTKTYADGLEGGVYGVDYTKGMPTGAWFESKNYIMYEKGSPHFGVNSDNTKEYYSNHDMHFNINKNMGVDYTYLYDYAD